MTSVGKIMLFKTLPYTPKKIREMNQISLMTFAWRNLMTLPLFNTVFLSNRELKRVLWYKEKKSADVADFHCDVVYIRYFCTTLKIPCSQSSKTWSFKKPACFIYRKEGLKPSDALKWTMRKKNCWGFFLCLTHPCWDWEHGLQRIANIVVWVHVLSLLENWKVTQMCWEKGLNS